MNKHVVLKYLFGDILKINVIKLHNGMLPKHGGEKKKKKKNE